jgi:hypothetical protein
VPERAAQGLGGVSRKSLPGAAIEESVMGRIREAQVEAVHSVIARVGYDGRDRQISIRFHERTEGSTAAEGRA